MSDSRHDARRDDSGSRFRLVLISDGLRWRELTPLTAFDEVDNVETSVVTWGSNREKGESPGRSGLRLRAIDCSRAGPWPLSGAIHAIRVLGSLREIQPVDVAILRASPFSSVLRSVIRRLNRTGARWCYWGESPFARPVMGLPQQIARAYLRRLLRSAWAVLGVGSSACESWRAVLGASARIHLLPYVPALDSLWNPAPETLAAAARVRQDWLGPAPVIALCAGELTRENAHDTALEAFISLANAVPNLCLAFAGEGILRTPLETRVRRAGLEGRVRFLPADAIGRDAAYLGADFAVLPARAYKPWGTPVHRALAAGLPVVVSDRVGCRDDLVEDGRTGFVVPAKQTDALTAAIRNLAQDEPRRQRMGRLAVEKARQFDAPEVAQRLLHFLQS